MYIIDDRNQAGRALRQAAETLAKSGEPFTEWPQLAADALDLQWKHTEDGSQHVATMHGQLPEEDQAEQRVDMVRISAETRWQQGRRTTIYTATPLARRQPTGRHPRGRMHGIKARIDDWLDPPSPRELRKNQDNDPERLMTHMTQITLEAVMRMAQGLLQQAPADAREVTERKAARRQAETAVTTVNRQSAHNRANAAISGAGKVPVEVVRCSRHGTYGYCQVMMDGSHQGVRSSAGNGGAGQPDLTTSR